MRRVLYSVIGLVGGYLSGAATGMTVITLFSGNTHDKALEAVMTAAFVVGPIGAVLGLLTGLALARRR